MTTIDRIPFQTTLPNSFFSITHDSSDDPAAVLAVFRLEAVRNKIIVYTDHQTLQLVGIFPHDSTEAYFGFWETTNNLPANQRAFSMLETDARQLGQRTLIGPMNFNTFYRYRLRLTNAPSWGRFDREPTNPAYYPMLMNQLGFRVRSRFESRLIRKEIIPGVYQSKQELLAGLTAIPVDFISINPDTWQQNEDEIAELVHQVFSANPAYKSIQKTQFQSLYNQRFAATLCPYSSVLFRDKQSGKLVAMSFCQPDYQSLELPAGHAPNFVRDFPRLDKKVLLVKSVGVHPAFRQRGLMSYIGAYGMLGFREWYDEVIFCLMRSDNFSTHFSIGFPYECAQYALFDRQVSGF